MTAQSTLRGLYGYYDGTVPRPTTIALTGTATATSLPPDPTPIFSKFPSLEEWVHQDSLATSLLVLNVKDPVDVGLKTNGTAREAWKSLEDVHGRITDLGPTVATMRGLWAAANDMGTRIDDPQFLLRTLLMSAKVINFNLEEAETNAPLNPPIPTTALNTNTTQNAARKGARHTARKTLVCANPNCGVAGKKGHTIDELQYDLCVCRMDHPCS
ncbi:hypothetical protein K438DRAFT_1830420 [Mycena galopus ATCC 62051]|nr:hypothetical protein K438DRAFT_1830420 [Mycena galopus ATCC 62051]